MKIRYKGGRRHVDVSLNRKSYHFSEENNMILETKDQGLINYIFSLPNRTEFEVVEELQSPPALQENKKTILPEKHPDNFVEISKKKKYKKGGK